MRFWIYELRNTKLYGDIPFSNKEALEIYETEDEKEGSYIYELKDNEEREAAAYLKLLAQNDSLVISEIKVADMSDLKRIVRFIRYGIETAIESAPEQLIFLEYNGTAEREQALKALLSEALVNEKAFEPIFRHDFELLRIRLSELMDYLELYESEKYKEGRIEIDDDGYPVLLFDTENENEIMWFRYLLEPDRDLFLLQKAVYHKDSDEYMDYEEVEEEL